MHNVLFSEDVMGKRVVYVSGLPRSGSTLMCQLLGSHPDVFSTNHSSPLAESIEIIRNNVGNSNFLLSQLDSDPDGGYNRLKRGMRGFMEGWLDESECSIVVDKGRLWLSMIETLKELDPSFKMIVCIRNLVDVFASVERKHRQTILLPFPDDTTPNHIRGRVSSLFGPGGVIGSSLNAISNTYDIPDSTILDNVFYVAYEALMSDPIEVMNQVYQFIGASKFDIDTQNLPVKSHESDSYYRMKYPHKTCSKIDPSFHSAKEVSPRVVAEIINGNRWFYEQFYPGILQEFDSKK